MKIIVIVKPNSKKQEIIKKEEGLLEVRLKTPPVKGKNNKKFIETLAKYYQLPKKNIIINTGHKSRKKIIKILK